MNPKLSLLVIVIVALAAFRLLPHPPNLSPIAAMALFAGAHFADRRLAFIVPLVALMLSDLWLGFHSSMLFVYAAFAMIVTLGFLLRERKRLLPIMGLALIGSVLFFLVTNFGAWLSHSIYPHTAQGLLAAYTAGLPFFQNTLLGDLLFTAVLFGGFYLFEQRLKSVKTSHQIR